MSDTTIRSSIRSPAAGAPERAIAHASVRTGVDFGFLLAQARIESGLDSDAKARTSSATGLFQFIEQTWLDVIDRHGARHGLGEYAAALERGPHGARVSDPALRSQILALRNDPHVASLMAAELANDNRDHLSASLGRAPDGAELYLAHFLGAGGAERFLGRLATSPGASAAAEFAQAASANRPIFYTAGGAPRSYAEVMEVVRGKFSAAVAQGPSSTMSIAASGSSPDWSGNRGHWSPPQEFLPGAPRPPVSALLAQGFLGQAGEMPGSMEQASQHARRAYERLKAFGL